MKPPEFEYRSAFTVLGVGQRIALEDADWQHIWTRLADRIEDVGQFALSESCYGIYFETDTPEESDFVAGMLVPPGTRADPDLVCRDVPAADYAVFECELAQIGATWREIFGGWIGDSGYTYDEGKPCFEEFRPGVMEGAVPVRIYVPVRPIVS